MGPRELPRTEKNGLPGVPLQSSNRGEDSNQKACKAGQRCDGKEEKSFRKKVKPLGESLPYRGQIIDDGVTVRKLCR